MTQEQKRIYDIVMWSLNEEPHMWKTLAKGKNEIYTLTNPYLFGETTIWLANGINFLEVDFKNDISNMFGMNFLGFLSYKRWNMYITAKLISCDIVEKKTIKFIEEEKAKLNDRLRK